MKLICNQHDCNEPIAFLFTWPGEDQAGICAGHAPKLRQVAEALCLHLQLIPVVIGIDQAIELLTEKDGRKS